MNFFKKIERNFSLLVNKLAGGTMQNVNTGEVKGEAFPGIAAAARKAAADGSVLLINDGVLPLAAECKVALFGRVQSDWFYVGYGSGGDVRAPYLVSPVEGLKRAGVKLDPVLLSLYDDWRAKNPVDPGFWGHWPLSHPEMPLSEDVVKEAAKRCDVAVILIGRSAGEDRDCAERPGSYYLTAAEKALISSVERAFTRTVVVLDIGSPIDFAWTEELPPSALLVVWQGGMESGNALADILTGKSEPGGRLTDTIARRYADYPSSKSFGNKEYNEYTEDIYVGYRYFETFARDKVLFPFGAGEGYTTFSFEDAKIDCTEERVAVTADVVNTGERRGREVAQLYIAPPRGGIPRPARELAAFAKTPPVGKGERCTVALSFDIADIAAFDDKNTEWVVERGEYALYLGKNVRDAAFIGNFEVAETLRVPVHSAGAPVLPFKRLTSSGGKPVGEDVPLSKVDLRARIASAVPDALPRPSRPVTFADVKRGAATPEELAACLSDEELEAISRGDYTMNSPLGAAGNAGAIGGVSESLRAKGIPAAITTDGPSGIRLSACCSLLPSGICLASSWDTEGTEALMALVGAEMRARGSDILLAPGMNIHRNPLGGRNFEYFSEDPLITGKIAAAYIRGVQSQGVSACPKHFACNNQERNRTHNDSRLSERALREIYLKGFSIAVKEGKPLNIMTSYNKINGVWGHYNYDLCTTVLRGEWGYDGCVMTDWWMRYAPSPEFPALRGNAYRVRAGVDVLMPGGKRTGGRKPDGTLLETLGKSEGISRGELQRTAAAVIRMLTRLGTLPRSDK